MSQLNGNAVKLRSLSCEWGSPATARKETVSLLFQTGSLLLIKGTTQIHW